LANLIMLYLNLDQVKEARAAFDAYTAQNGQDLNEEEKRLYAWIYLREQLLLRPNDANLLNDLGGLALGQKDPDLAEEYLEQAYALAPEKAAIMFNLGLLKLQQKQYSAAVSLFEKVLAQEPDHHKAAFNLGLALKKQGKKAEAREIWKQLLKATPADTQTLKAIESLEKNP
jgi:Flp pilus assembly protein TadD